MKKEYTMKFNIETFSWDPVQVFFIFVALLLLTGFYGVVYAEPERIVLDPPPTLVGGVELIECPTCGGIIGTLDHYWKVTGDGNPHSPDGKYYTYDYSIRDVYPCPKCSKIQHVEDAGNEEDYNEDWGYTEGDSGYTEKDDDGVPIAVVIGGGAAVGAAVTIILKAARKKKTVPGGADRTPSRTSSSQRQSENKQDQDQPEGYILNISEDNVSVSPETSAQLIATVLRVFADGSTQRDPSAPITVSLRPNSDLQVIPLKGFGEVSLSISQKSAEPTSIEEYIDITAVVSGTQKTARVKVSAAPAVQIVFF